MHFTLKALVIQMFYTMRFQKLNKLIVIDVFASLILVVSCGCLNTNNLATATDYESKGIDEMVKEQIIPDILDEAPKSILDVKYGDLQVKLGNTLTPTQVKNPPNIYWKADPKKLYLLCMIDPDCPERKVHKFREFHHWLVGNIPGSEISKGEMLTEYVGAGPPKGSGLHRYIILVYEQPIKLTFDEKHITARDGLDRAMFSIKNFAKKYKLGAPISGNFFQSEWDESVTKLHEQMSIPNNY